MPRRSSLTMTDALKKRIEPLAIPLSLSAGPQLRRFRVLHVFSACCCLVLAILSAKIGSLALFFVLYAIAILLRVGLWPIYHKRYQLLIDDRGIRGQLSWLEYMDLPWHKIAADGREAPKGESS
jgi:Flp pilus assembly protein TadB